MTKTPKEKMSRASIKGRRTLGEVLDESYTSANLGNDRGFIIKEYYLDWYEVFFGEPKPKLWLLILKVDNIIALWRVVFV